MERIGIREMRRHLSQYAQRARAGESFLITDRGADVARLIPAFALATPVDRLVAERGARRGHGDLLTLVEHPR